MKRRFFLNLTAVFVIAFAVFPSGAEELIVGYADEELFPYAMGNGDVQPSPPGIYIEMLDRVARELGITIEYRRVPTLRGQLMLKRGELDAFFGLSFKTDRIELGQYPVRNGVVDSARRISTLTYSFYKLEKNPATFDGSVLLHVMKPVGANSGYSILDEIRRMGFAVDTLKTTPENLRQLKNGWIDVYAGQDVCVDSLIADGKYGTVVKLVPPIVSKDYYLLFSHRFMERNAALAERIWTRIGAIRDGMTQTLVGKYASSETN